MMILYNRYRILQELGSGGFGQTYLAEDTHLPSNRKCIVKKLIFKDNDPKTLEFIQKRFQREAVLLEKLGECNQQIPKLYAYFVLEGYFYLVQECIDGDTLTQRIKSNGRFAEQEVKRFLIDFLPILEYIHSEQVIHRDIKPDNIIIRRWDSKPVLIDFGAVKEIVNTVIESYGSQTTMIVGTGAFMPMEQVAGRPVLSTDLYSLGLTAIYMLTGKHPKELRDPLTNQFLWHNYAPTINATFAAILDKSIQEDYRNRYATAYEMHQALGEGASQSISIDDETTKVRPVSRKAVSSHAQQPNKAYTVEEKRKDNPKAYSNWSEDENRRLRQLFEDGKKTSEISKILGRSIGAISSQLRKLGLKT